LWPPEGAAWYEDVSLAGKIMQSLGADRVQVILAIEVQDSATWDWGAVEWRDILIVAETTDTSWCK
jgi:hypothetical protein